MKQESSALESYLQDLRAGLTGVPAEAVEEFVREVRADLVERGPDGDALRAFGDAAELARQYRAEMSVAQVAAAPDPWRMLRATRAWARASVWGVVGFAIALVGYLAGAVALLCAVAKPFAPDVIGLWTAAERTMLGLLVPSDAGTEVFGVTVRLWPPTFVIGTAGRLDAAPRELLGFWLVPVALVAGLLSWYATTRLLRRMARQTPKQGWRNR